MTDVSAVWRPDSELSNRALAVAREIASADDAVDQLARYYTVESDYAGATFAGLTPHDPNRVTPTDLLAATTLSVDIPPITIRRLTADTTVARRAAELLESLDPALGIEAAEARAPQMAEFYELVKSSLHTVGSKTSNAWVTASKICARKRPRLFPVRDTVVTNRLGLKQSYPDDWPVFAALMTDEDLGHRIDAAVLEANSREGVDVGDTTLRLKHLDVLLWMAGR